MIIYNTTFHTDDTAEERFLEWLKGEFIPRALENGILTEPRLTRVFNHNNDSGQSYSLQFRTESLDRLSQWYETTGNSLIEAIEKQFGEAVAGFSTLLDEIEL